jgi:hypothetical protein
MFLEMHLSCSPFAPTTWPGAAWALAHNFHRRKQAVDGSPLQPIKTDLLPVISRQPGPPNGLIPGNIHSGVMGSPRLRVAPSGGDCYPDGHCSTCIHTKVVFNTSGDLLFQSTLPAWWATHERHILHRNCYGFNPRPPRGGRR